MIYRLHREGVFYLLYSLLFFAISVVLFIFFMSILTGLLLGVATFFLILFLIFFRNPPRVHGTKNTDLILAPADGKIVVIERTFEAEYLKSEVLQVSVFMSPLNVHSNRSPVTGEVVYVQYHPGEYLVAWHPKSSELNERNTVVIKKKNSLILLRQIAGKVARKIVCYTKPGDLLSRGEEFGFIKFGSRVDIFLPTDCEILVKIGDTVKGGITEIASFPHSGLE
ncbi:MAG: phosphatidylserine decarboxylase family protein [Saprospiraceae bacterium]|nr:phosphatidylserine decarboxylase family protein [Candidatus Opimibacter skivensis]MBL0006368.1 phosphatidylserine decarboxylase family protein [Candidatus Opimibacter skivensis]MBP6681096.1 phosphatidylserine decarboxylase family protein [Saprospiraceae bacterium]MBP8087028.1 phosphatidylserine decarboxylase family protein [Saprospiraceae bacterium]